MEKPRSAGPAGDIGNAPTRPIQEEIDPSSVDVIPAVLRELARTPEIFVAGVARAFDTTQIGPGTSLGAYRILSRVGKGGRLRRSRIPYATERSTVCTLKMFA